MSEGKSGGQEENGEATEEGGQGSREERANNGKTEEEIAMEDWPRNEKYGEIIYIRNEILSFKINRFFF